jgi:hypothetical protein
MTSEKSGREMVETDVLFETVGELGEDESTESKNEWDTLVKRKVKVVVEMRKPLDSFFSE